MLEAAAVSRRDPSNLQNKAKALQPPCFCAFACRSTSKLHEDSSKDELESGKTRRMSGSAIRLSDWSVSEAPPTPKSRSSYITLPSMLLTFTDKFGPSLDLLGMQLFKQSFVRRKFKHQKCWSADKVLNMHVHSQCAIE
eukprot:3352132-Pleurochrysis_carterae.AAC.4